MKPSRKNWILSAVVTAAGAAAAALRLYLDAAARDNKGLLVPAHPAELVLWLLTAAVVIFVMISVRKERISPRYTRSFPACTLGFGGCLIFAAGTLLHVIASRNHTDVVELVGNLLGLLAVPSLTAMGICRKLGKRPHFFFPGLVCLWLVVFAILRYQSWSGTPQFLNSVFSMAASLLLMAFAYQHTAFTVNMGSRRTLLISGLLSAFCCFAAAGTGEARIFYLAGGVWAVSNLCDLSPQAEKPLPESPKE